MLLLLLPLLLRLRLLKLLLRPKLHHLLQKLLRMQLQHTRCKGSKINGEGLVCAWGLDLIRWEK
jgi:hypothetical protein